MIDQPWTLIVPAHQQPRHKPVKDDTYWPVLDSFNKWNIIQLSHQATSFEDNDKIIQVVPDGISESMDALV